MTTMRCEAVRDALPELARGALGDAEAAALRAHLAACDDCADAWAVVGALAAARVAVPAGLADRVTAHVAGRARRGVARRRSVAVRWLAGAGLVAAALTALVVGYPDRDEAEIAAVTPAQAPAAADPFLDARLFGGTTPTEAELDGLIRVAALDPASLPSEGVAGESLDDTADLPPLALDVGASLGDWPGADGMSAGDVMLDQLTYDEMQLLLTEMET